jgi:hypothetical protein
LLTLNAHTLLLEVNSIFHNPCICILYELFWIDGNLDMKMDDSLVCLCKYDNAIFA